jgi:hypothetical protein
MDRSSSTDEPLFQVTVYSKRDRRWTPTNSRAATRQALREEVARWRMFYDKVHVERVRPVAGAMLVALCVSLGACATASPSQQGATLHPPSKPPVPATTAYPGRQPYQLSDIPGDVAQRTASQATGMAGSQASRAARVTGNVAVDNLLSSGVRNTVGGLQRWWRSSK